MRAAVPQGDRLAGWAMTADGRPVVATEQGLVLPDAGRVAWHAVEKATWERPRLTVLVLAEGPAVRSGAGPSYSVVLDDPRNLAEVVRTRVTGSVAWSSHATLRPAGGVRIVGRRNPDREVFDWQLVFDRDTDLDDPLVQAQAQELLEAARRTIG